MTRELAKAQSKARNTDGKPTNPINPLLRRKPLSDTSKLMLTTQLAHVATKGDIQRAGELLAEGADIDGLELDWPPIVVAALNRETEMLLFLGMKGADLEARDKLEGRTALMWAAANGFLECVVALTNSGARTDGKDNLGNAAYGLAVQNRHYVVAEFLEER
jgi:ankyrin repeat protein